MADDALLRERLRRVAADTDIPARDLTRVKHRTRALRTRRAAATILVAALAAAGIAVPLSQLSRLGDERPPASDGERVVRFAAAPGWHVIAFEPDRLFLPYAWAANVPFALEDVAGRSPTLGYPDGTIESLPENGVVIVASVAVETRNALPADARYPERPLVLDAPRHDTYEGQRPGTSMSLASASVNGRFIDVTAVFGSPRPGREVVRAANEQLAGLVVTPAPTPTNELDDFRIRLQVPDDWDRGLFSRGGELTLLAGTLPLTDLYDGTSVRPRMGANDLFVVLAESFAVQDRFEPVDLPIELRREDECPTCEILDDGRAPPADHTLFARTFSVGDRRFRLYAEFGTTDVPDAALEALNGSLATLTVDAPGSLEPWDPQVLPPGPAFTAVGTRIFEYQGLRVEVPAEWSAAAAPLDQPAVAPVVAAFGSWPFPTGGACGPEPALGSLPDDGVLVWMAEHPAPGNRGDYYGFVQYVHDPTTQPARWECATSAPSTMLLWEVGGRYLEVHVALGPAAGRDRIAEVTVLLNSLRVSPTSP
jgi:hypothetical protein